MTVIFVCDSCGKNMRCDDPSYSLTDYDTCVYMDTRIAGLTKKDLSFKAKGCLCPECNKKYFDEFTELAKKYKLHK